MLFVTIALWLILILNKQNKILFTLSSLFLVQAPLRLDSLGAGRARAYVTCIPKKMGLRLCSNLSLSLSLSLSLCVCVMGHEKSIWMICSFVTLALWLILILSKQNKILLLSHLFSFLSFSFVLLLLCQTRQILPTPTPSPSCLIPKLAPQPEPISLTSSNPSLLPSSDPIMSLVRLCSWCSLRKEEEHNQEEEIKEKRKKEKEEEHKKRRKKKREDGGSNSRRRRSNNQEY